MWFIKWNPIYICYSRELNSSLSALPSLSSPSPFPPPSACDGVVLVCHLGPWWNGKGGEAQNLDRFMSLRIRLDIHMKEEINLACLSHCQFRFLLSQLSCYLGRSVAFKLKWNLSENGVWGAGCEGSLLTVRHLRTHGGGHEVEKWGRGILLISNECDFSFEGYECNTKI